jgi:hypothetical protein
MVCCLLQLIPGIHTHPTIGFSARTNLLEENSQLFLSCMVLHSTRREAVWSSGI